MSEFALQADEKSQQLDGFEEKDLPIVMDVLVQVVVSDLSRVIWHYAQIDWFEFRQIGGFHLNDRIPRSFAVLSQLVESLPREVKFLEIVCSNEAFFTLTRFLRTGKRTPELLGSFQRGLTYELIEIANYLGIPRLFQWPISERGCGKLYS